VKTYTRKNVRAIPREPHMHDWGRVHAVKGNSIRFGCAFCPAVDRWDSLSRLSNDLNALNRVSADAGTYLQGIQKPLQTLSRAFSGLYGGQGPSSGLADAVGPAVAAGWQGYYPEALWTVDDEGRTPDETTPGITGPMGGIYPGETVPRAPGHHKPLNHKEDDHDAPEDDGDNDNEPVMLVGLEGATIDGLGSIAVNKKGDVVFDADHPHADIPDSDVEIEERFHVEERLMKMVKADIVTYAAKNYGLTLKLYLNKRDLVDRILEAHDGNR